MAVIVVLVPEVLPSIVRGTLGFELNTPLICILVAPIMSRTVVAASLLSSHKLVLGSLLVSSMLALSARDPVLVPALSVAVRVIVKVSVPSVSPSLARVNVAVPVFEFIVILPVNDPALKSFALMPVTV
jgi:hypothetical protein